MLPRFCSKARAARARARTSERTFTEKDFVKSLADPLGSSCSRPVRLSQTPALPMKTSSLPYRASVSSTAR